MIYFSIYESIVWPMKNKRTKNQRLGNTEIKMQDVDFILYQ